MPDPARLEIIIKDDGSVTRTEPGSVRGSAQSQSSQSPAPDQPGSGSGSRSQSQRPQTRNEPPPSEIPSVPPPPSALSGFGNIAQRGAGLFGPDILNVAVARFSAVAGLFGDAQKQFSDNLQRQRDTFKQQADNARNQMDAFRERRQQDPRLAGSVPPAPTRLPVAVSTPRIIPQRVKLEQQTEQLMKRLIVRMDRLTARIDSMFRMAQQRAQQMRPFTQTPLAPGQSLAVPSGPRAITVEPRRLNAPPLRIAGPDRSLVRRVDAPVPARRQGSQLPSVPAAPRVSPASAIPSAPPQIAAIGLVAATVAASLAAMAFAVNRVNNLINEMSAGLEDVSPSIQRARADQEITQLRENLRREDRVGEDLARFIKFQTDAGEVAKDLKADVVKIAAEFLPIAEEIVGVLKDIRPLIELGVAGIQLVVENLGNILKALGIPAKDVNFILKMIRDALAKEDVPDADILDESIKDFLGQDVIGIGQQPFNPGPLANQPAIPHQGFVPGAGKFFPEIP